MLSDKNNFPDYETALSKEKLDGLFDVVKKKLINSSAKYGETYWLNNIEKELGEEIVDILGWTTLEALRLLNVAQSKFANLDKIYWDRFFEHQTDLGFLENIAGKVKDQIVNLQVKEFFKSLTPTEVELQMFRKLINDGFTIKFLESSEDNYPILLTGNTSSSKTGRFENLEEGYNYIYGDQKSD